MLLLFDYGHGGADPGATYKDRKEAEDVLKIGQAVAAILRSNNVQIDETRSNDTTISLQDRVKKENNKQYDYFISFHRNAFKPEESQGAETFIFSVKSKAKPLAEQLQKALVANGFKNRGVKTAPYYVLKYTKAPAILLEIGFIDNSEDNKLFEQSFQNIAQTLATAILQHTSTQQICPACHQVIR